MMCSHHLTVRTRKSCFCRYQIPALATRDPCLRKRFPSAKQWVASHSSWLVLSNIIGFVQYLQLPFITTLWLRQRQFRLASKQNKKFELMLTGRAKAYSSSCPQAVTHHSTNRARRRVTSFQLKRVTNDATPPMPAPWHRLVNDFVSQSEIAQKIHKKSLFWHSRSSKVIEFSANRKPVYNFLLVINSNLDLISHRYWDTVSYSSKIANFDHPLSFSDLGQGDPLWIYEKALRLMKLESSRQPTVKIWRS